MRRTGILAALVVASLLSLPGAYAHGPGAESTHLEDSLILTPSGTASSTALVALSGLGEVEAGDELRYFWQANAGQGPAVRFEILREMAGSTPELVYGVMATTETETWVIPGRAEYTASWENPTGEAIALSYLFEVLAPLAAPPAFDWPLYLGLGAAGVAFALLFFWSGRRKGRKAAPAEAVDETGQPEE